MEREFSPAKPRSRGRRFLWAGHLAVVPVESRVAGASRSRRLPLRDCLGHTYGAVLWPTLSSVRRGDDGRGPAVRHIPLLPRYLPVAVRGRRDALGLLCRVGAPPAVRPD